MTTETNHETFEYSVDELELHEWDGRTEDQAIAEVNAMGLPADATEALLRSVENWFAE